jgi:hypothetical protein
MENGLLNRVDVSLTMRDRDGDGRMLFGVWYSGGDTQTPDDQWFDSWGKALAYLQGIHDLAYARWLWAVETPEDREEAS